MANNIMNLEDFTTLKASGDGNCLFRSIIQSLLAQGLIKDEKIWVMEFIHDLVQRTEKDLELDGLAINPIHIDALNDNNEIKSYATIEGSILKIKKPNTFNNFIAEYNNLPLENLNNLLNENEPILYYLSACLRKDILSYHVENGAAQNLINEFSSLHTHADISNCSAYLNKHKIKTFVATEGDNPNSNLFNYSAIYDANEEEVYKIDIHLKYTTEGGRHYDALLLTTALSLKQDEIDTKKLQTTEETKSFSGTEEGGNVFTEHRQTEKMDKAPAAQLQKALTEWLNAEETNQALAKWLQHEEAEQALAEQPEIKKDEALVKQSQIEEGEMTAKEQQMEEIEIFAKQFKSSGNNNKLSFINDVIKGLGLEKELDTEKLNRLKALPSATSIEDIVLSLQSIINKQGYTSDFKKQFERQIQRYSFFSTRASEPERADAAQTLSATPTIQSH